MKKKKWENMCICEMGIIKKNGNILKKTKKNKKKGPTIPV
jgi:hypothetical protein